MKALHIELKDIRIQRGITIEDIHRTTKIRTSFLESIEEGDFSVAPELFIRAFLREYAEAIGIDPKRVLARQEGKTVSLLDDGIVHEETPAESSDTQPVPEAIPREIPAIPDKKDIAPEIPALSPPPPIPVPPSAAIPAEPAGPAPEPTPTIEPETVQTPDIIGDTKPQSPTDVRATGGFFPEEESKSPRALIFGFFFLVVIIAALVVLYINGVISF